MENKTAIRAEIALGHIESHLDGKLRLEDVAHAVHYSKYHLHRLFTGVVGMTVHDYVLRRQLTEAAKLLVFSARPIIDIAFICGYESQQAFSTAFKAMYKLPPAQYRERRMYYPLQLRFTLNKKASPRALTPADIGLAQAIDIPEWMALMRLAIDGFPHLDEADFLQTLERYIADSSALILRDGQLLVGAMMFAYDTGSIEFMGVHPQYRSRGVQRLFLDRLMQDFLPGRAISTTTYRESDKADTGYRSELKQLGFAEKELLTEFSYPTQRFVLPPK